MRSSAPRRSLDSPTLEQSNGPLLLILTCTLTAFAVTSTSLRLLARYLSRRLGWDDYSIALTTLLAVGRTVVQILQDQHGNGKHRETIGEEEYAVNNELGLVAQLLLFSAICMLKTSICFLIVRLKESKAFRIGMYLMIALLFATNFGCVIILLAECRPISAYWNDESEKCWDPKIRVYAIWITIAFSIVTDLICSFLPLLVLWNAKMDVHKKLLIGALISLGLLATAFAIVRATSLGLDTSDLSWDYCITAIWSNLELFLGIIAANLALSHSIFTTLTEGPRPPTTLLIYPATKMSAEEADIGCDDGIKIKKMKLDLIPPSSPLPSSTEEASKELRGNRHEKNTNEPLSLPLRELHASGLGIAL